MDQEEFENILNSLKAEGIVERPDEARHAILVLEHFFENELTIIEAQLYVGLALDLKEGLFGYLVAAAQGPSNRVLDGRNQTTEVIKLISNLIVKFPQVSESYVSAIVNWCIGLLSVKTSFLYQVIKLVKEILLTCQCTSVDFASCVKSIVDFLSNEKKITPTLKQSLFSTLGTICENQPDVMVSQKDWFAEILLKTFSEQNDAKNHSESLIEGCFNGLEGLLKNFTVSHDNLALFYGPVSGFCTLPKESGSRLGAHRASISVFTKHISSFYPFVYKDNILNWSRVLTKWINLNNTEDKHRGILALTALYQQTSIYLTAENPPDDAKSTFESLKKDLEAGIIDETSPYLRKKAIAGISELAECYLKFASTNDLRLVLNKILALSNSVPNEMVSVIGVYLVALAKIFAKLNASPSELTQLCKLTVQLIDRYPEVPMTFRKYLLTALESSFCSLFAYGLSDIENHLHSVIFQGLIRCCSHRLDIDAQILEEKEKVITHKMYVDLWKFLLTMRSRSNENQSSLTVGAIVYDTFMSVFLEIMSKLDLEVRLVDQEVTDPDFAFEPRSPNDFLIFTNLVAMFEELVPDSDLQSLSRWLPGIFTACLRLHAPLVSGFYKIIGTCFKAAIELEFFSETSLLRDDLVRFLEKSMRRVDMLKDDLQIACLNMILAAPTCLVEPMLELTANVLLVAIRVGKTYLDLLKSCLSALERWRTGLTPEQLDPLLTNVLPAFDTFLQSCCVRGNVNKTYSASSVRKQRGNRTSTLTNDRELLVLQKQFLIFIGKLQPNLTTSLLDLPPEPLIFEGGKLIYKVHFPDAAPELTLNTLLPRVIELATSSGDRSTRITACETFHAILLLAIARTRRPEANANLFQKLISTALILSCDKDNVIAALFRPLLLQTTHFYSSKLQFCSNETAIVIEVLMDGATHSFDISIRDFSASCIKEFITWSIKQTTPEDLAIAPFNISAILRKLETYAVHPDRCKRLGAATVFNNIYTVLREETAILEKYWFQMYHVYFRNLGMCSSEDDARIIIMSIKHILRPLSERSGVFQSQKKFPSEIGGGSLKHLIIYTFKLCNDQNRWVRKMAQLAVSTLIKVTKETLKDFISNNGVSCKRQASGEYIAHIDFLNWLYEQNAVDTDALAQEVDSLEAFVQSNGISGLPTNDVLALLAYCSAVYRKVDPTVLQALAKGLFSLSNDDNQITTSYRELIQKIASYGLLWATFTSFAPSLDEGSLIKQLESYDKIEQNKFVRGFMLMQNTGKLKHDYSSQTIIGALIKNMFTDRGRQITCNFLDPNTKKQYEELFEFALKQGIDRITFVRILCDDTNVHSNGKKTDRGTYLFSLFKNKFVDHIINDPSIIELLVPELNGFQWILAVLEQLKTYTVGNNTMMCRLRGDFALACLDKWNYLVFASISPADLLSFLKTTCSIAPERFGNLNSRPEIFNWAVKMLLSCNTDSYDEFQGVFELFPQLSSYMEKENDKLYQALTSFRNRSRLFQIASVTSVDRAQIKDLYFWVMEAINVTGSMVFVDFLKKIVEIHLKVINIESIDSVLSSVAVKYPSGHVQAIANSLCEFLFAKHVFVHQQTLFFLLARLVTVISKAPKTVAVDFFMAHFATINNAVTSSLAVNDEALMIKKILAVRLIELLYSTTENTDRIHISDSCTGKPGTAKEVFTKILNSCSLGQSNAKPATELLRLFYCACVNFRCTFISKMPQTAEKPYVQFLFTEAANDKKSIWRHVVDEGRKYELTMDFADVPKRKVIITSIRSENEAKHQRDGPVAYAHSQTLFASTLSEDVRNFDLTHVAIDTAPAESSAGTTMVVELELDSLNSHEVVPSLCALVRDMSNRGISPPPGSIPCWLSSILHTLTKPGFHRNARFLAFRVLQNLEEYMEPYVDICADELLAGILNTFQGLPTNYLMVDALLFLIRKKPTLTGGSKLTELLQSIVVRPGTSQKNVLRYINDVIKGLIECWKNFIDKQSTTEFISSRIQLKQELDVYITLNFLSVSIGNNIVLKNSEGTNSLIDWLLDIMAEGKKNCQLASEVLGMMINYVKDEKDFSIISSRVVRTIQRMAGKAEVDLVRLYYVHKFYPEISDSFVSKLINLAWSGSSELKRRSLEMILTHVSRYNGLQDQDLESCLKPFLIDLLKSNISIILELVLKIIFQLVKFIDEHTISSIYESVFKLSSHSDEKLRLQSVLILIEILGRFQCTQHQEPMVKNCKVALLKRLNDVNDEIQGICQKYWCQSVIPQVSTKNTFIYILNDLYMTEAESDFVEYACRILLEAASRTVYYNEDIEQALTNCTYSDLAVNINHRAQYASQVPPMFAPSVTMEMTRLERGRPSHASTQSQIQIRATAQSLMFQPTQAETEPSDAMEIDETHQPIFKKPKLPYRFRRSHEHAAFAKIADARKEGEEKERIVRKKERESNVRLYRTYRTGDFPDVQIKHSHFLTTLLGLAVKDQQVAKELFVELTSSLVKNEPEDFWVDVSNIVSSMLQNSHSLDVLFVGAIFQFSLTNNLVLDTKDVCRAAKGSGLLSVGTLLIEHTILYGGDSASSPKRSRNAENEETTNWLRLARLYQDIGDVDGLRGIFLDKLKEQGSARSAIFHEASAEWLEASKCYGEVLNEGIGEERTNFYAQAYYRCLAQMSDWGRLKDSVDSTWDAASLWRDPEWTDFAMYQVRSEMMHAFHSDKDTFQEYIQTCSKSPNIWNTLNTKFTKEVCLSNWLRNKLPQAIFTLNQAYLSFLSTWSQVSVWDARLKTSLLHESLVLSEIQTILHVLSTQNASSALSGALQDWAKCVPSTNDDLLVWDIRLAIRQRFLAYLDDKTVVYDDEIDEMKKCLMKNNLIMAKTAALKGNMYLSNAYLRFSKKGNMSFADQCLWKEARNLLYMLAACPADADAVTKVSNLSEVIDKIEASFKCRMNDDSEEWRRLSAHAYCINLDVISTMQSIIEESALDVPENVPNQEQLKEIWRSCASSALESLGSSQEDAEKIGEVNFKMAKFLKRHGTWEEFVLHVFRAMKFGNVASRQLFGLALTMEGNKANSKVEEESKTVPSWMFLMWRQQLLSFLPEKDFDLVQILLERIANDYPNSLSYGIRLAKESYPDHVTYSNFFQRISQKVLNNNLQDKFVHSISQVASPELKVKYYIERILLDLNEKLDLSGVFARLEDLKTMIQDPTNGDMYSCVSDCIKTINIALCKKEIHEVEYILRRLIKQLSENKHKLKPLLKLYSPWLSEYNWSGTGEFLEVPGQYDVTSEPRVQNHVKIAAFKPEVVPLPSKTRPFKLTIIGNNAKQYNFLVKFGEDLRQDERIQQVFRSMKINLQAARNGDKLELDCYEVIPLTSSLGLIEWVENTKSLRQMILSEISEIDIQSAQNDHIRVFKPKNSIPVAIYREGYKLTPHNDAVRSYNCQVHKFQANLLRRQLWNMSESADHFVSMRANFAKSLAVLNIAQWIIGVGDRHLENILISKNSGRVLGIDFGCAFGLAMVLPIPEFIPFRLTPQILGVLSPLNESGWLKQTMINTLRVLREEPSILLAILDVFIKEPSVDWKNYAKKLAGKQGSSECEQNWFPRQKIDAVAKKLAGANPVASMEEDLKLSHENDECYPDFVRVLKGLPENNFRRDLPLANLSVEQQIDSLLDLAQDPLILAFTYCGWNPWL